MVRELELLLILRNFLTWKSLIDLISIIFIIIRNLLEKKGKELQ